MAERKKIWDALTKSQERAKHLESQVEYLQDKLSIANKSRYKRFKDYIKERVAKW